jgi:hypothetical protein
MTGQMSAPTTKFVQSGRHYCCYFDRNYLPRSLAMIRSLRQFDSTSTVWVLCLDDDCFKAMRLLNEPRVNLVRLEELVTGDAELETARANRSRVEFIFTCTPSLIRFVLQRIRESDTVTYVDGDLFFYSDPAVLHEELGEGAVSLIRHRFSENLRDREKYGHYNVGWLTFRNDSRGISAVNWWRSRCNEWCYDYLDGDKFADQKYLDRFPELFDGVVVLEHDGANVAPWNIARYGITSIQGKLYVRQQVPLVFFHFHGFRPVGRFAYRAAHRPYRAPFRGVIRRTLYKPYVKAVSDLTAEVEARAQHAFESAATDRPSVRNSQPIVQTLLAFLRAELFLVIAGKVW